MSLVKLLTILAPVILLAGCSTAEGEFPSLERRPYENNSPIAAPEAVPAPAILTADLAAKVALLDARHRTAERAFRQELPAVRTVASKASNSAPGSESWVNAHLQLSRLDKARADSVAVVREYDALIADQGDADTTLVLPLTEAQKPVADAVAAQNAEIERLSQLIGE
jgi:hypothetical protein